MPEATEVPEGAVTLSQLESSLMTINERVVTPPVNETTYFRHLRDNINPKVIAINDLFDDLFGNLDDGAEINEILMDLDIQSRDLFRWCTMLISTGESIITYTECSANSELRVIPRIYLSNIVGFYDFVTEENKNILLPFLDRFFASFIMAWGGQMERGALKTFVITIEEMAMFPAYMKTMYAAGSKMVLPTLPVMYAKLSGAANKHFDAEMRASTSKSGIRSYVFWDYSSVEDDVYSGERFDGTSFEIKTHGELLAFLFDMSSTLLAMIKANPIIMIAELRHSVNAVVTSALLKKSREALSEECYQGTFTIGDAKTSNVIRFLSAVPVF